MKAQHSTNFWIVFALWVFMTLFMSLLELIAILEVKDEQIALLKYVFFMSSSTGILLVIFNSLFLFKSKVYFKNLAIFFLVIYLFGQIGMLAYCFYKEIPNLGNAATIRIIFILLQIVVSYFILRMRKN